MSKTSISLSLFKMGLGDSINDIDANINGLPLSHPIRILWHHASNLNLTGALVIYIKKNFPSITSDRIQDIFDNQQDRFLTWLDTVS
jgi:hypothetical protein